MPAGDCHMDRLKCKWSTYSLAEGLRGMFLYRGNGFSFSKTCEDSVFKYKVNAVVVGPMLDLRGISSTPSQSCRRPEGEAALVAGHSQGNPGVYYMLPVFVGDTRVLESGILKREVFIEISRGRGTVAVCEQDIMKLLLIPYPELNFQR